VRIFLILVGVLLALFGVACGASGIGAFRSVDGDGYVSGEGEMFTSTAAVVVDTAEFREIDEDDEGRNRSGKLRLRVRAERMDGGEILIGIGQREDVDAFLEPGSYQTVRELEFDPLRYNQVNIGGSRELAQPSGQLFVASARGDGLQEVDWPIGSGEYRAIIMNGDGSAGVDVRAEFGVRFPYLRGFAIAAMIIGSLAILLGLLLVALQFRAGRDRSVSPEGDAGAPAV
jgi:hypothetical protein